MNAKITVMYETEQGFIPFQNWPDSLKDKVVLARIQSRLMRVESGNFGDAKSIGEGVSELRFVFGSGYRIYFGQDGTDLVLLLVGGDKATQSKNIKVAQAYWANYLRRTQHEKNKYGQCLLS